ncbi:Terpenoid synthase [Penicillium herquei]|nr:Terpenoid synthase [Penicillium herquei]
MTKGVSQEDAKTAIRAEIAAHKQRFCQLRDEYKATADPTESILRLLELLENSIAGNFVWSLRVPRYCNIARNPYRDHFEGFGGKKCRVVGITGKVSDCSSGRESGSLVNGNRPWKETNHNTTNGDHDANLRSENVMKGEDGSNRKHSTNNECWMNGLDYGSDGPHQSSLFLLASWWP